ncbi:hypothetical protein Bca4012_081270 [Brassica carinata]
MNASKLIIFTVHEVLDEQERKVTLTKKSEKPAIQPPMPPRAKQKARWPNCHTRPSTPKPAGKVPRTPPHQIKRTSTDQNPSCETPSGVSGQGKAKETKENKPSTKRPLNTGKSGTSALREDREMTAKPKPQKP